MIRSFKHRGLKRLYEHDDRSGIRPDLLDKVERIITALDSATALQALDIPGYRLHPLKGEWRGFWSVTVGRIGVSFFASKGPMPLTLN